MDQLWTTNSCLNNYQIAISSLNVSIVIVYAILNYSCQYRTPILVYYIYDNIYNKYIIYIYYRYVIVLLYKK